MNIVRGRIKPLRDNILISDMNFDMRVSSGGIFIPSDDAKSEGIRPRWGRVWAIGPEQTDVKVGEWVLLEHGRWTRGVTVEDENGDPVVIRRADNNAILLKCDEKPSEI